MLTQKDGIIARRVLSPNPLPHCYYQGRQASLDRHLRFFVPHSHKGCKSLVLTERLLVGWRPLLLLASVPGT